MGGVIISLTINVLLLSACIFYEIRTHHFLYILDAMGVCRMDSKLRHETAYIGAWCGSLKKMDIKADIAFLGNSITQGSDFSKYFPDKKIVTLGLGGDRIDGMTRRISLVEAVNPKKLFIMGGINDLHRSGAETVGKRYEELLKTIKSALPQTKIYTQSILPVSRRMTAKYSSNEIIRKSNEQIKKLSEKYDCVYIDLYSLYEENGYMREGISRDGVHLLPRAYDIWAEAITPHIYEP